MKRILLSLMLALIVAGQVGAAQYPVTDPSVGGTFTTYRTNANNAATTLDTMHSGPSAPTSPNPYSLWADTTTGTIKQYNPATNSFTLIGPIGGPFAPPGMGLIAIVNETVTGTTLNKLTKLSATKAIVTAITDTSGALGVTVGNAGTTGSASIQLSGQALCVFDGATTNNDFVSISASVAGDCHDAGATFPASGQVLGRVLSTNGGGGTYSISLFGSNFGNSVGVTSTGPVSVTGNQTNGADQINHVSLNNTINPQVYGAVASDVLATCSATAGVVTCSDLGDFKVGDGIAFARGGAMPGIATPAALTATNILISWFESATVPGGGGAVTPAHTILNLYDVLYGKTPGGTIMPELPMTYGSATGKYTVAGGLPTFAAGDAGLGALLLYESTEVGATSHTYDCSAFPANFGLTGKVTTINATGAATLSSIHRTRLSCPATGATGYAFWKDGAWLGSTRAEISIPITGATNATPIVITAAAHGMHPGAPVAISGVAGNTAANNSFVVLPVPAPTINTFAIGATGNGAYTSGGTAVAGGTFDDYAPVMAQSNHSPSTAGSTGAPWFMPSVAPVSARSGPLMGATSITSNHITAINGSTVSLEIPPTTDFTNEIAIHDNTGADALTVAAALAISTAPSKSSGATIKPPPGTYNGDWMITGNATLDCGNNSAVIGNITHQATYLQHVRPGQPLIDTDQSGATTFSGGILGCATRNFAAGGMTDIGIRLGKMGNTHITKNAVLLAGDEGIIETHASSASFIEKNSVQALFDSNRIAYTGAARFSSVDDHITDNAFAAAQSNASMSSPAGFNASCFAGGTGGWWNGNNCEFGDEAIINLGTFNTYHGKDRVEFAAGHGFLNLGVLPNPTLGVNFAGGGFANLDGLVFGQNGHDAQLNGVFDDIHQTYNAPAMQAENNTFQGQPSGVRHFVWDAASSVAKPVRWANNLGTYSTGPTESPFQLNPLFSSGISFPSDAPASSSMSGASYAGNSTPDVAQKTLILLGNVAPTNITNFCNGPAIGGVCQQESSGRPPLGVLLDSNSTLVNDATKLKTLTGSNVTGTGKWVFLLINNGVWQQYL